MARTEHVGIDLLVEGRTRLLAEYDSFVREGKCDYAKTAHGVSAESLFRRFLRDFLPKKFGVTKGYIITPDLDYDSKHLEEWDIVIYDALESPILHTRRDPEERDDAGKLAIPIEYVRAIIEVKATLNGPSVKSAVDKLLRLQKFPKTFDCDKQQPKGLPNRFTSAVVFYETKVTSATTYSNALTAFEPLFQYGDMDPLFLGGLIIRAQSMPERSGGLVFDWLPDDRRDEMLRKGCEVSRPFGNGTRNGEKPYMVSSGFGLNEFWGFLLDLVYTLNMSNTDKSPETHIGESYGFRDEADWLALFPPVTPHEPLNAKAKPKAQKSDGKTPKKKQKQS